MSKINPTEFVRDHFAKNGLGDATEDEIAAATKKLTERWNSTVGNTNNTLSTPRTPTKGESITAGRELADLEGDVKDRDTGRNLRLGQGLVGLNGQKLDQKANYYKNTTDTHTNSQLAILDKYGEFYKMGIDSKNTLGRGFMQNDYDKTKLITGTANEMHRRENDIDSRGQTLDFISRLLAGAAMFID